MAKIGLIYGSSTGNTENVAYQLQAKFNAKEADLVDVHNIGATTTEQILKYDFIIFGIPTWNTGELQDDWEIFFPKLEGMDFKGKKVALFGLGDQNGYGFNFLDAMGMLADEVLLAGGDLVGYWRNNNYEFEESLAADGTNFCGLGVDEEGQKDLTETRIEVWVEQVYIEFFKLEEYLAAQAS
jgi:flavodoxin I